MPGTGLREHLFWLKQEIYGSWKHKVSTGNLANNPHIDSDGKSWVDRSIKIVTFARATTGEIKEIITNLINTAARGTTPGFKVYDVNVYDRYMGELLMEDDLVVVQVATPSSAFNTRGHTYLLVTVENPTWVTNPTGLTVTPEISTDAFDTEDFLILAQDGVAPVHTCLVADAAQYAFYISCMQNAGAVAATNNPTPAAVPDIDGMTMRLLFTPAGAGITGETLTVNVYGVTPR